MGIQGLMKLIAEEAPNSYKELNLDEFTGRKIAIDASMAMYQFLIAVRSSGTNGGYSAMLTNDAGEVTSHIQGMLTRTIKIMACGVKPVYVFDGKPPQMKGGELAKRMAKRAKAEADLAVAKEQGNVEDVDKYSSRLVKVSRQHNEDCKELLRLMGVPVVEAPCEAEAQCAELARAGKVYATNTEDMDALTFRTPKLLRRMTFSGSGKSQKQTVVELDFEKVIAGLGLAYEEFVDLCILCGCDYCTTIKGIGPKTALKLIREHKSIENVLKVLSKEPRFVIPPDWRESVVKLGGPEEPSTSNDVAATTEEEELPEEVEADVDDEINAAADEEEIDIPLASTAAGTDAAPEPEVPVAAIEGVEGVDYEIIPPLFVQARALFLRPDTHEASTVELKWELPDEEKLREFLVTRMGFQLERVNVNIEKLKKAHEIKPQRRMDSFFTVIAAPVDDSKKRKAEAQAAADKKGKAKGGRGAGYAKKR
jgi:flap endonuclease-1